MKSDKISEILMTLAIVQYMLLVALKMTGGI